MSLLSQRRSLFAATLLASTVAVPSAAQAASPLTLTSRVDLPDALYDSNSRVAVGDFNGDGIDDHAVGGRNEVTVYFGARGSVDGGGTLKLTAVGNTFDGSIGKVAVSEAGDPDGDGYDDLLVYPQTGATKTFLVYGAATSPATLPIQAGSRVTDITTGNWGPQYPHSVGIGDFNGDGKDDFVVPSKTGSGTTSGTANVAIIAGGSRSATLDARAAGGRVTVLAGYQRCTTSFSFFYSGWFRYICNVPDPDVAPIGDFNGDGKSDLYVSSKEGTQWIVLGRSGSGGTISAVTPGTGSVSLAAVAANPGTAGYWGSVKELGDVNGDGTGDFTLPVSAALGGGTAIIRGRTNPPSALPADDQVLRIESPAGTIATPLGTAGDQNGDGRADVLVAQRNQTSFATNEVVVATLPAGATSLTRANQTAVQGNVPQQRTWSAPAAAGDLDGDGATDAILYDPQTTLRLTHTGAPVKPRLEVRTTIEREDGETSRPVTVTATCSGTTRTQEGSTGGASLTFGSDGSISVGDQCTVTTTPTLPSDGLWTGCTWTEARTFRGAAVSPNATITIGNDPNLYVQRYLCAKETDPEPQPDPAFPTDYSFSGWKTSGCGIWDGTAPAGLTAAPNQAGSFFWPKPIDLRDKTIDFNVTMTGGNGAAEGVTLALVNNAGGQPAGGFLGAGGGQLGFGGLTGQALAFDGFKQPEDAQANTVSWVDGTEGSSLHKLYSRDAGLRMRGRTFSVRAAFKNGAVTVVLDRRIRHTFTATLPSSVFLGFTASTGSSVWQYHSITDVKISDSL